MVLRPNSRQDNTLQSVSAMRRLQNKTFLKQERVLVYWNPADKYSYDPAELEIKSKRPKVRIGKENFQSYRPRTKVNSLWSVTTGQPHA